MIARFNDRRDAGRRLAARLAHYAHRDDAIVLALPRGGIPVGYEVATALGLPLDVFVVRKLGLPWHEELAMGALASGGVMVLDQNLIRVARVSDAEVNRVIASEELELERRERLYRGRRVFPDLRGITVILVDDGLATGSTIRVAITALREEKPARIVAAVPVAAPETCDAISEIADEMICAETPEPFHSVGLWYSDFGQTTDEEVHQFLEDARTGAHPAEHHAGPA